MDPGEVGLRRAQVFKSTDCCGACERAVAGLFPFFIRGARTSSIWKNIAEFDVLCFRHTAGMLAILYEMISRH